MYALNAKGERIVTMTPEKRAARREAIKNGTKRKDLEALPIGPYKEVDVDLRWVAVTAILDNQGVREALVQARKISLAEAFANYRRVNGQRQIRRPEGDWSDWKDINREPCYEILDNLPELSPERLPEPLRPEGLVDFLPRLKKGTWSGVDPEPLLRLAKSGPDRVSADGRTLHGSPSLAVRYLDFTVEPGATYRYRVRVVVRNPDADNDGKKDLLGPWSEPTGEVAVP
jgi:hypothetical protein